VPFHPVTPDLRQNITGIGFVLKCKQRYSNALLVEPVAKLRQDLWMIEVGKVRDEHRDQVGAFGDQA
jgi:hypothetical protein